MKSIDFCKSLGPPTPESRTDMDVLKATSSMLSMKIALSRCQTYLLASFDPMD